MCVEDEMNECSVSCLTLQDTESKDTDMLASDWDSHLIKTALLDNSVTHQPQSSPAKEDNLFRGKVKTLEVSKHRYNDDFFGKSDTADDLAFPTFVVGSPSKDIFKVWDLECSFGEDELLQQFGKPLSASLIQTNQQNSDVKRGLKQKLVNHLTMELDDLSLNQGFGRLDRVTSGIAGMSLDQSSGLNSHS